MVGCGRLFKALKDKTEKVAERAAIVLLNLGSLGRLAEQSAKGRGKGEFAETAGEKLENITGLRDSVLDYDEIVE